MILLEKMDDWKQLFNSSTDKTVVLLKHSTTCPISAEAYHEFQAFQESVKDDYAFALVKVIEHRPVSNAIAEETGVRHESPQCLIIKNQQVQWVDSHWKVTKRNLEKALA
jgi:bacillithiol system protein YtxJ